MLNDPILKDVNWNKLKARYKLTQKLTPNETLSIIKTDSLIDNGYAFNLSKFHEFIDVMYPGFRKFFIEQK